MLHGREAERDEIGALLNGARSGQSRALVIRGEAGIGKSALLEDARERAGDMQVLSARPVESESELPFAALHQLLRPAVDVIDLLPDPQAEALRVAVGLKTGVTEERFLVFAACLSLLAEIAERRPLLCVIDDAQWLDQSSAEALLFVARRLDAEGIVMLFGAREGDVRRFDAGDIASLLLEGLDDEAASTLLQRQTDGSIAESVLDHVVAQAQGNALALVELPSALTPSQLSGAEPLPETLPLTQQVETIFLERVRSLPEKTQRLLLIAAADDSEDLAVVLSAASTLEVDDDSVDVAERANLLEIHGTRLGFRHPLVRSAVYGAATSTERRQAHRALAAAMSGSDTHADRAAWHLAASTVTPDEGVVRALEQAAERAETRAGYIAAARARERAAELSVDDAERGRLLAAAARCAATVGADDDGVRLATAAATFVHDAVQRAEIARSLALAEIRRGRPIDAVPLLTGAARELRHSDPAKALDLLLDAGMAATSGGDLEAQADVWALAGTVEPPVGDESSIFVADVLTAFGALAANDPDTGMPKIRGVVARGSSSDDPRHALWAGFAAMSLGDERRASEFLRLAATQARMRGAIGLLPDTLGTYAILQLLEQHFDEAVVAGTEAVQFAREIRAENEAAVLRGLLAFVSAIRGEDEVVVRDTRGALDLAARGHRSAAILASWSLAMLDLGRARWEAALVRLAALDAWRPSSADGIIMQTAPDRIEAAVRAGDGNAALEVLADFEGWSVNLGATWASPRLASCRALVADGETSTRHYEEALELSASARPFDRARIHLLYGEHLRRERRRSDARSHLRTALEAFERFRAAPWTDRAAGELRATGEKTRKRDPSSVDQLTPKEIQIARLVAEGQSNKEVAAQLFLSPRTIDSHLRSVYAKLGVTSRTQLARVPLGEDTAIGSMTPVLQ